MADTTTPQTDALLSLENITLSGTEIMEIWEFAESQLNMIKDACDNSDNYVLRSSLAIASNCIINIMDEIQSLLLTRSKPTT